MIQQTQQMPVSSKKRVPDPQQQAAINHDQGPAICVAGAGTGKTHIITERFSRLIGCGVAIESILLVTFTNKAAEEMSSRIRRKAGISTANAYIGTFHAIGYRTILQKHKLMGFTHRPTKLEPGDAVKIIRQIITDLNINTNEKLFPQPEVIEEIISKSINKGINFEQLIRTEYPNFQQHIQNINDIFGVFVQRKKERNLVDFDDMLLLWLQHLLDSVNKEAPCKNFDYIMVDEYQDVNWLQAAIIDTLARLHGNVMIVGDDAQAIYGWRGGDVQNMLNFPQRYSDSTQYLIETNYRSTPEIVALANASIANNKKQFRKNLVAHRSSIGIVPTLAMLVDEEHQACFIAEEVLKLRNDGVPLNEMAVLFRVGRNSKCLELELTARNIPYEVRMGRSFFQNRHILEVLGFLKVVDNPKDEFAWNRVLRTLSGIGPKTAPELADRLRGSSDALRTLRVQSRASSQRGRAALSRFADLYEHLCRENSPALMINEVMGSPYRDYLAKYDADGERVMDIQELSVYANRFDSLDQFLMQLALVDVQSKTRNRSSDRAEEKPLVLSTIHKAKGLEWNAAFVISINEGNMPTVYTSGIGTPQEEEERRLFYVAVTRAMDRLYLCYTHWCDLNDGTRLLQKPSRFISELPAGVVTKVAHPQKAK